MAKMSLSFEGLDEMMKKLERLDKDTKAVTEEALTKAHEIVTAKAEQAIAKSNLPARGHYSHGDTAGSLQRTPKIKWSGSEASVEVGFNIRKGGLPSIFLMYGTPKMAKVQSLYDAFYSSQTEGEVINAEKEIFLKAMGEIE